MADKLLKSIKFPTLPDRYVIGDTSLSEEGAAADAKAVGEALATKADTKGRYEDLIVGGAEQLMADGYETDTEPYLFRPTGGSADVGNREYLDKIVGGTVAWNQLVNNVRNGSGGRIVVDGDVTTISAFTARYPYINSNTYHTVVGHKYLVWADVKYTGTITENVWMYLNNRTTQWGHIAIVPSDSQNTWIRTTEIYAPNVAETDNSFIKFQYNGTDYASLTSISVKNIVCIDLTAMFGTTIADYIYSLEQSQAGAGVAWFKKLFPKDYYAHNAGELMSVKTSAHQMVGFNAWDEEWRNDGYYNATGKWVSANNYVSAKNLIPVLPNTAYHASIQKTGVGVTMAITFWDADEHFIERRSGQVNTTFTTPSNAHYILFNTTAQYGTTYTNDICINLSDPSRNGEYEPYQKHTYPLDSSLTLRGVPKLVDGKLAFDGDVYLPSGEVDRRYKQVTLTGSENWNLENGVSDRGGNPTSRFYIEKNDLKKPSESANTRDYTNHMNSTIPTLKGGYVNQFDMTGIEMGVTGYQGNSGDDNYLYIIVNNTINTTITTVDALKSWLSSHPLEVVYELETPTTETADGYEQYQRCDPSGTEEFVTTGIVPVGHETRYPHDLKKKIETAPDSPSADGTYLMKRSGGKNTYMALPSTPSANGAYVLTVTVSGGSASYSWAAKG